MDTVSSKEKVNETRTEVFLTVATFCKKEEKIVRVNESDEIGKILCRYFYTKYEKNFILYGEDDCCLCEAYLDYAECIKNFEIRNDDIIVASHPKSGTTWTQEMVWLIENNFDYVGAQVHLDERFPFLERCTLYNNEEATCKLKYMQYEYRSNSVNYIRNMKVPRFIKTHLPFSLLPYEIQSGAKTPKIIYVIRDPKDVCVSYFYFRKLMNVTTASFDDFIKVFLAGKVIHGPFWKNVLSYWNKRFLPNILFICYEDMKKDLLTVIKKVAKFLNKNLPEEKIPQLLNHLSFESMKNNKWVNRKSIIEERISLGLLDKEIPFVRSGTTGTHKEKMSHTQIENFNKWIKKNVVGTSLEDHPLISVSSTVYLRIGNIFFFEMLFKVLFKYSK
ncbi:hypothetical protein FQA39_LY03528 [Lamprigera yunnana]|nr:hypothetical protein FQA39_LY03528 [Lamprigera yunnana]